MRETRLEERIANHMNWIALVIVGATISGVLAFEGGYAYLDRRWGLPLGKEIWSILFWSVGTVVLISCEIMPWPLRHAGEWAPFFLIGGIHAFVAMAEPEWSPMRRTFPHPGTHPPVPTTGSSMPTPGCGTGSCGNETQEIKQPSNNGN